MERKLGKYAHFEQATGFDLSERLRMEKGMCFIRERSVWFRTLNRHNRIWCSYALMGTHTTSFRSAHLWSQCEERVTRTHPCYRRRNVLRSAAFSRYTYQYTRPTERYQSFGRANYANDTNCYESTSLRFAHGACAVRFLRQPFTSPQFQKAPP